MKGKTWAKHISKKSKMAHKRNLKAGGDSRVMTLMTLERMKAEVDETSKPNHVRFYNEENLK